MWPTEETFFDAWENVLGNIFSIWGRNTWRNSVEYEGKISGFCNILYERIVRKVCSQDISLRCINCNVKNF
jgi:hypothetical protein